MDIQIARDDLATAVDIASAAVANTFPLPILGNLRIDTTPDGAIQITGTDMELEFVSACPANVSEPGAITVPAAKLKNIVKALPSGAEIRISTTADKAIIKSGRGRYQVATLPANDFPAMGAMEGAQRITLPAEVMSRVLAKVAPCMAKGDVRYYLNGAYLSLSATTITAVATDGHRLGMYSANIDVSDITDHAVILPFRAVTEFRKLLVGQDQDITFSFNDRMASVESRDVMASTKLVDGRYPEYQKVIPILDQQAIVDRVEFINALRRAVILANDKYRGARVTFAAGRIEINAQNQYQEEGNDIIDADYNGESVTIGLNIQYAADALSSIDTSRVVIEFKDASSSLIMRGEGAMSECFVIMPMRI